MATVADNRGTTTLAYESANDRVSSVTDPVTGAVGYTYGLAGQRVTMSLPGGGTWTYSYGTSQNSTLAKGILPKDDPNSISPPLSKIVDDQGRIVEYKLDLAGRLHESKYNEVFNGGGQLVNYCDTAIYQDSNGSVGHGWLARIRNAWGTVNGGFTTFTTLTQNEYTYNNSGMRLTNAISDSTGLLRTLCANME